MAGPQRNFLPPQAGARPGRGRPARLLRRVGLALTPLCAAQQPGAQARADVLWAPVMSAPDMAPASLSGSGFGAAPEAWAAGSFRHDGAFAGRTGP